MKHADRITKKDHAVRFLGGSAVSLLTMMPLLLWLGYLQVEGKSR